MKARKPPFRLTGPLRYPNMTFLCRNAQHGWTCGCFTNSRSFPEQMAIIVISKTFDQFIRVHHAEGVCESPFDMETPGIPGSSTAVWRWQLSSRTDNPDRQTDSTHASPPVYNGDIWLTPLAPHEIASPLGDSSAQQMFIASRGDADPIAADAARQEWLPRIRLRQAAVKRARAKQILCCQLPPPNNSITKYLETLNVFATPHQEIPSPIKKVTNITKPLRDPPR